MTCALLALFASVIGIQMLNIWHKTVATVVSHLEHQIAWMEGYVGVRMASFGGANIRREDTFKCTIMVEISSLAASIK